VRVVPWPEIPAGEFGGYITAEMYDEVLAAEQQAAREYLDQLQAKWSKDGLLVSTVIRDGLAAEGIHDVADELGAYAIAVASHGRGGIPRLVLGSVAERLLQQATIPVLLVREGEETRPPSLREVLVPLDGSVLAERAIDQAREILPEGGVLVLERVVEPIFYVFGEETAALVVDEAATAQAESSAKAYLDEKAAALTSAGIRVTTRVHRGRPASEILSEIETSHIDMIVMTTHGHTGPTRWLMGSVADEIFRHTHRPVLLVSVRTVASRVTGAYTVRDLMTRDVEVVTESEAVSSVLRKLLRRRVSGAPVIDASGQLVGVVTEHDLLTWHNRMLDELSKDESSLDPAKYAERLEADTIASIVTRPAVAIDADAGLTAAIRMLLDRGLRRLPVTDDGRLVGIISRADILKGMAEHWSSTNDVAGALNAVR
jgi:nucleotide-binding universal stress UspA family protein/predicted transcriptional regulator